MSTNYNIEAGQDGEPEPTRKDANFRRMMTTLEANQNDKPDPNWFCDRDAELIAHAAYNPDKIEGIDLDWVFDRVFDPLVKRALKFQRRHREWHGEWATPADLEVHLEQPINEPITSPEAAVDHAHALRIRNIWIDAIEEMGRRWGHMDPEEIAAKVRELADSLSESVATSQAGGWAPVDLAPILAGDQELEPPPAMLARADGPNLLYAAKIHQLIGEPESGKGWLALVAAKERLEAGEPILYIDFEDEATTAVSRLRKLGVSDEALQRFRYVRPDEPLGATDLGSLSQGCSLAVLDGMTDALMLEGFSTNDNDEVAQWQALLPRRLKRDGLAVLIIDHVTKDPNTRGRYGIGAQKKLAGVDVNYGLEIREPMGQGHTGRILLRLSKDRPGHLRPLGVGHGQWRTVAEVVHFSQNDSVIVTLDPPPDGDAGEFRPTTLMERVSQAVADHPGLSITRIRATVEGKATYIDKARELLVQEGFIEERQEGQARRYYSLTPFRADGS